VTSRSDAFNPAWLRKCRITALFIGLTAVMTWPQTWLIATHAAEHQDIFFNLWRLRWVAHALATSPGQLFNANIFYPERVTLALSDAMLLQGVLGGPLFGAGLPPLLVHNLLLLGAIVASGAGMYTLARHVTGSRAGGIAAGIVFAFAPYRFEHYMHMELQWAMWIPWAFWALQRTIDTGDRRAGLLTGTFVALQLVSSIYYGIFLAALLPVVALVQVLPLERRRIMTIAGSLALGGAIAGAVAIAYSVPYIRASKAVGVRDAAEVIRYSAKPRDYLTATPDNWLYGSRSPGRGERRLFPGFVAPLLALVGLLLLPPNAALVAYSCLGIAAFELSLGMNGWVYPWLYEHIEAFQGLRAPARASIFCLMAIGLLAARGLAALEATAVPRARQALVIAIPIVLLVEYWVAPLRLVPYHNAPPPLYAWLRSQPRGIVAEFPMPPPSALPGREQVYAYMSTFHWMPLLNGYSGYYPPEYLSRLNTFQRFPESDAIERLRRAGATYVVVHASGYGRAEFTRVVEKLIASGLPVLTELPDGDADAVVFRMR
jgi:hypothetical protein